MLNKLSQTYSQYKERIKKGGIVFIVFAAVKSLVFFAPLSICYLVNDVKVYGQFEYTLNLGQSLISIFTLGLGSAMAFFVLKEKKTHYSAAFHLHFFIISIAFFLISVLVPSLNDNLVYGSLIIGAAFAYQIFSATYLKIKDRNIASVFADSALYFLMAAYAILLYFHVLKFEHKYWHLMILGQMLVSNLLDVKKLKGFNIITKKEYIEIYKYGFFSVIAGSTLYLLSNSTRLFIEPFTSYADVGLYSYYFRIGALVVIIHRVIGIIMYKKFYTSSHQNIDKFYAIFLPILFVCNVCMYLAVTFLCRYHPKLISPAYISQADVFVLVMFQVNFWCAIALFEVISYREELSLKMFFLMLACLAVFVGALYVLNFFRICNLNSIIIANAAFISLANFGQIYLLKKKVHFYKKTFFVQLLISSLFIIYVIGKFI